MYRIAFAVLLIWLSVFSFVHGARSEELSEPERAVRNAVSKFFQALASNDPAALATHWSSASDPTSRTGLNRVFVEMKAEIEKKAPFARLRGIEAGKIYMLRMQILEKTARAWGGVGFRGIDAQTGKVSEDFAVMLFGLMFVREGGDWKVQWFGHPQEWLVSDLLKATTREARQKILQENRELADADLIMVFRKAGLMQVERKQFEDAHRLFGITIEVASFLGDKGQLADAYIAEGITYLEEGDAYLEELNTLKESKYEQALANIKTAIPIFHEAGDRRAVGRALLNYASVAKKANRPALAMEVYETSLSIARQTDDAELETLVLLASAESWQQLGNRLRVLSAFQQCLRTLRDSTDLKQRGRVLFGMMEEYQALGQYADALRVCEQLRKVAEQMERSDLVKEIHQWAQRLRSLENQ
jgi:tetratricopeptide (TPR) repeat protein